MYKYRNLKAGQLPQEHLSFLQNLLNFIITNNLKNEFYEDLSVVAPLPLCNLRYKDLSMSHDQKVIILLPPMEKCPYRLLSQSCFYCPNLITVASL